MTYKITVEAETEQQLHQMLTALGRAAALMRHETAHRTPVDDVHAEVVDGIRQHFTTTAFAQGDDCAACQHPWDKHGDPDSHGYTCPAIVWNPVGGVGENCTCRIVPPWVTPAPPPAPEEVPR